MAIVSVVNYTTIFAAAVTGATALLVGLVGYFSTRLTAKVALNQSDAETQRLREQRDEAHFQHRQSLYHTFLNKERTFHDLPDAAERDAVRTWLMGVVEAANGVILFGTTETAFAASSLLNLLVRTVWNVPRDPGESYKERLDKAYVEAEEEVIRLRRELMNAIRNDCAPDRRDVEWPVEPVGPGG